MDGKTQYSKYGNFPKLMNSFNAIPIKIPERFLVDTDKSILKCILRGRGTRIPKTIFEKEKMRRIHLPVSIMYYIATVIKPLWYWQKCRLIEHCDRIDNPEIYASKYAQLSFTKM